MSENRTDQGGPPRSRKQAAAEFGEDTTGFGGVELRTLRDTLVRPRAVLEAYMTGGPSGGGLYTRPLKLYLGLCGVLMLLLFLKGGAGVQMEQIPAEQLAPLIEQSGKSRDAFIADVDGWMSLTMVPILAAFYALAGMPLLRLWDPDDLGWPRGMRASFIFLNVWTLTLLPIAWFAYDPAMAPFVLPITTLLAVIAFWRTGRGRWWRTPLAGVGKGLLIAVIMMLSAQIGMIPVMAIGIFGGMFGP